jgi:hypothetical protein
VLKRAEMRRTSFRTLDTCSERSASTITRVYSRVLEIGIVDACRIRSGMGRGGVVTRMEGMPRRRVAAFSTGVAMEEKGRVDASCKDNV